MTRVYMPEITAGATRVEVRGDEAHHLSRVVRARVGEVVGVFDGRGHEWRARIEEVSKQAVMLAIDAEVAPVAEPAVHVTLAIGVLKGDQMDTVVRDATVMGVSALVPLATDHVSVPTRAWRDDAAVMRWQRVAVAAAKQCQRAVVPAVSVFVDDVGQALKRVREAGLEIVHPLTVEPWGVTRFFYRDSDGNVINVGTHTLTP